MPMIQNRNLVPYPLQAGMDWEDSFEKRRFIGDGVSISNTDTLEMPDGRKIQIIVREDA